MVQMSQDRDIFMSPIGQTVTLIAGFFLLSLLVERILF